MQGYITKEQYKKNIWKGQMKEENFYKFILKVFVSWEIYYAYWFLTIHKKIIKL